MNDRMIQEAAPNAKHFGVAQDWRTLADYFKRIEERSRTGGLRSHRRA